MDLSPMLLISDLNIVYSDALNVQDDRLPVRSASKTGKVGGEERERARERKKLKR